jgi:hypothetical protein
MPEQPCRLFEGGGGSQFSDGKARNDQFAAFAIHMTETRRRGDDTVQTAIDHVSSCSIGRYYA